MRLSSIGAYDHPQRGHGEPQTNMSADLSAAPPADLVPSLTRQHHLGRDRRLVRDVIFAAPAGGRDREDQINIGRIDVLPPR